MSFNKILGHKEIINYIQSSIKNNRINHAYILTGQDGVGKLTLAKEFAKTLNCEQHSTSCCDKCISCKTFDSNNNPDIIYVTHEKKDITVSDIRNQVIKNITVKPYRNKYKIFIIDEADKMNIQAQNALLKTLEEPADYAIFILLCENYNKLLVTILSRCIMFKLRPLPHNLIQTYLNKTFNIDFEQAYLYSVYSQGSIGKANQLINSTEFRDVRDSAINIALNIDNLNLIDVYNTIDKIKEDKETLKTILDILYLVFRDALVYKETENPKNIIQRDKITQTKQIALKATTTQLINRCDALSEAQNKLLFNINTQLLLETLFFKLKEK